MGMGHNWYWQNSNYWVSQINKTFDWKWVNDLLIICPLFGEKWAKYELIGKNIVHNKQISHVKKFCTNWEGNGLILGGQISCEKKVQWRMGAGLGGIPNHGWASIMIASLQYKQLSSLWLSSCASNNTVIHNHNTCTSHFMILYIWWCILHHIFLLYESTIVHLKKSMFQYCCTSK